MGWNVSLPVFASLLSLILWELLLRKIFINIVEQSITEYSTKEEDMLFNSLDTDHNGLLSTYEWLPYFYQCASIHTDRFSASITKKDNSTLHINNTEEIITIQSFFIPVHLETLKKDPSFFAQTKLGALTGLVSWTRPHQEWRNFVAQDFSIFLPARNKQPTVGDTWWVIAPVQTPSGQLSSNRHEPPLVPKHLEFLVELFGMFHTRPFLVTRFQPQGTLATLRAANSQLLDVVFRVHLEYQLNEPNEFPFWFTPAQLSGRVIIDRSSSSVHYFALELPINRKLNVDMEWLNGPDEFKDMEVDIAFVPLMSLKSMGPSVKVNLSESDIWKSPVSGPKDHEKSIKSFLWDEEVTMEQSLQTLENEMYSFTKVSYHNMTQALTLAKEQNKPIHAILLWGALDDQSC